MTAAIGFVAAGPCLLAFWLPRGRLLDPPVAQADGGGSSGERPSASTSTPTGEARVQVPAAGSGEGEGDHGDDGWGEDD